MLQYLIILLDDTSVSFCHYENKRSEHRLISIDNLKKGILFAMKENLNIQFVYPDYKLPQEYEEVIDTIDHSKIISCNTQPAPSGFPKGEGKDDCVIVVDDIDRIEGMDFDSSTAYVLRVCKEKLFNNAAAVSAMLSSVARLNVVITDVEAFTDEDFETYKRVLVELSATVETLYADGRSPQLNILTDRMMLDKMNNCNAGDTTVTLAPDGKFYVCPAFYLASDDEDFGLGKAKYSIGDLDNGLDIKSPQLYKLDHAPLCRNCDAYQCKRCVWLNRKTTYEVNTPSHEQCVVAHLERNASRELLSRIRTHGTFLPEREEIKEIDYLDPFDVRKEW